jgi:hypothetical protein
VNRDDALLVAALRQALHARPEVATRPDLLRAMLNDTLGASSADLRREIALLVTAVEEGLPRELHDRPGAPLGPYAARLQTGRGLQPDAAEWTVSVWASALTAEAPAGAPGDLTATATSEPSAPSRPGDLKPRPAGDATVSRTARRAGVLALAAVLVLALVAGVAFAVGNDGEDPAADAPNPPTTAAPTSTSTTGGRDGEAGPAGEPSSLRMDFPVGKIGPGRAVQVTRTWDLGGTDGEHVLGTLTFRNRGAAVVPSATHTEYVPASLADSLDVIEVDIARGDGSVSLRAGKRQPVLRVELTDLAPGAVTEVTYVVAVAPDGVQQTRLDEWRANWLADFQARKFGR